MEVEMYEKAKELMAQKYDVEENLGNLKKIEKSETVLRICTLGGSAVLLTENGQSKYFSPELIDTIFILLKTSLEHRIEEIDKAIKEL